MASGCSQGEASRSGRHHDTTQLGGSGGIELATFRFPVNPLTPLLSHMAVAYVVIGAVLTLLLMQRVPAAMGTPPGTAPPASAGPPATNIGPEPNSGPATPFCGGAGGGNAKKGAAATKLSAAAES